MLKNNEMYKESFKTTLARITNQFENLRSDKDKSILLGFINNLKYYASKIEPTDGTRSKK